MPMNTERLRSTGGARTAHRSSLDIQALRATLAEIDFAFESDLEVVKNSAMDEGLKRKVIARFSSATASGALPMFTNSRPCGSGPTRWRPDA